MKTRIVSGLALGILFLFMTMQSLPWVLFSLGVMHIVAQFEFAALRNAPLALSIAHIILTTGAWVIISLCMIGTFSGRLALVVLLLLMLTYAISAVVNYERGRKHQQYLYMLRAVLLVTMPMACIPALVIHDAEVPLYLLLIASSWGADSGAIFAGKLLGRIPLSPRLSPKKTVEGAVGGMLTAGLIWAGAFFIYESGMVPPTDLSGWGRLALMFVVGGAIAMVGVFGDLVFSMYKRLEELKDFGKFIPGHGGVLDRFDSMLFVAPVIYIFSLVIP